MLIHLADSYENWWYNEMTKYIILKSFYNVWRCCGADTVFSSVHVDGFSHDRRADIIAIIIIKEIVSSVIGQLPINVCSFEIVFRYEWSDNTEKGIDIESNTNCFFFI